jgi:hypothetical protein
MGCNSSAFSRTGAGIAAAVCAAACAAPLLMPMFAHSKVTVAVQGVITPSCALKAGGSSAAQTVQLSPASATYQYGYGIECNAPFQYKLESQNGALMQTGQTAGTPGVPYNVAVHIPTDDVTIEDTCASASIKAGQVTCQFHDSRNGIAINGRATLTVSLGQRPAALAAGVYSDRITFSVGLRQ